MADFEGKLDSTLSFPGGSESDIKNLNSSSFGAGGTVGAQQD